MVDLSSVAVPVVPQLQEEHCCRSTDELDSDEEAAVAPMPLEAVGPDGDDDPTMISAFALSWVSQTWSSNCFSVVMAWTVEILRKIN